MKSQYGFDTSGWDGETFLWERVNELGDSEVLKIADELGFWSPNWEDEFGKPVEPNLEDLRGAIYDAWNGR